MNEVLSINNGKDNYQKINTHILIKVKIEEFLIKYSLLEWEEKFKKRDEIYNFVLSSFSWDWLKIKWIKFINWNLIAYYDDENWQEKTKIFDLKKENTEEMLVWDSLEKINSQSEKVEKELIINSEKASKILDAIDYIFNQNDKDFFWELNEEDILKTDRFWKDLEWKSLLELQSIINELFIWIDGYKKELWNLNTNLDKAINISKERYLNMIMWIWDKYEWWAKLFKKDLEQIEKLSDDIINSKSITWILLYLSIFHEKVYRNNYQSESVKEVNKKFSEILNKKIFEKLKSDNSTTNEQFLIFAKIITGRSWNIVDDLKDTSTANNVVLHLMYKKWWVVEKVNNSDSFNIVDDKINKQKPKKIVDDLISYMDKSNVVWWKDFLVTIWFWDLLVWLEEQTKYQDLDFEKKVKISTLVRFIEKLKKAKFKNKEDIWLVFQEIAKESRWEVYKLINDNLEWNLFNWNWKSAQDFWLKWVDKEIFDIFQDINWNWLFDISDNLWNWINSWAKFVWQMAWVIWVGAIWAWIASIAWFWVIATWTVVWATATIASIWIFPTWYDTKNEMLLDVWTNLVVWTATWRIWWVLTKQFYKESAKFWSKNKWWVVFTDLIGLWVIPEFIRNYLIWIVFDKKPIFPKDEKMNALQNIDKTVKTIN